jgi:hypothetical protein
MVVGAVATKFHALWGKNLPPPIPQCPAVLRSGETCIYDAGHEGYHRARIYGRRVGFSGWEKFHQRDYVWEDTSAGVHNVEFVSSESRRG